MALSDLISPKTEEFLSAIPALLGAYESARGKPIGTILSGLGQYGMQNVATRQKQGDVSALQKLLGNINPQQAPLAAQEYQQLSPLLGQMTPEMAEKQLENVEGTEASEVAAAEKYQKPMEFYNTQTGQFQFVDPKTLKNGQLPKELVPWQVGAKLLEQQQANQGVLDKPPATDFQALRNGYLKDHPGDFAGLDRLYHQRQMQDAQEKSNITAGRELAVGRALINIRDEELLPQQVLKGQVPTSIDPSDPNFLKAERFGNMADLKKAVRNRSVALLSDKDAAMVARMNNVARFLGSLNIATEKILPKEANSPLSNYLSNKWNKFAFPYKAKSGNDFATQLASERALVLQELNPILSGSSRAMAASEFNKFLGQGNALSSKASPYLDQSDIEAILPTPGVDTAQTGKVKLQALLAVLKDRFEQMGIPVPETAPGVSSLISGEPEAEPSSEDATGEDLP